MESSSRAGQPDPVQDCWELSTICFKGSLFSGKQADTTRRSPATRASEGVVARFHDSSGVGLPHHASASHLGVRDERTWSPPCCLWLRLSVQAHDATAENLFLKKLAQHTALTAQHSTQRTAHSAQRTAHSTQHTAHSTQHTAHSTQHTAHSTQHTAHSTQHTAHSTQHTAHSTQHTALVLASWMV